MLHTRNARAGASRVRDRRSAFAVAYTARTSWPSTLSPGMPNAGGARQDIAGERFGVVGVFVVEIVFADVDHGQLPQRGHVHDFVQQPLAQRAVAEETDSDLTRLQAFRRKCRAGRDARAAADDRIGSEIAGIGIGDVHRSAFAFAVAGFLAEQLGEHPVEARRLSPGNDRGRDACW